jgi:uncharacterized protein
MMCPKCDSSMSQVSAPYGSAVDRCDNCHGLFVGETALASLERRWFFWPSSDPHEIDSGDAAIGKQYNLQGEIDCPACQQTRMTPLSVPQQPHIWVERCPQCAGVFFDAGELTDLRYHTLADWVRDLLKPRRV